MVFHIPKLVLLTTLVSWLVSGSFAALSKSDAKTIKKWAPLVYLAKGEKFRPSTVNFFLRNMKISGPGKNTTLTSSNIPNCHLTTRQKLPSVTYTDFPFFKGQNSSKAHTYAILRKKKNAIVINYWFFYPFNFGKRVCLGFYLSFLGCAGIYRRFDNHVGDWERIKIKLKLDGKPMKMVYYAHGDPHEYVYKGKDFVDKKGEKIRFVRSHPIVYSAKGSHGSRALPGRHNYLTLVNGFKVYDECSAGERWRTWKNLKMVEYNNFSGWANFMKFRGRWGNRKQGCGIFNIYHLVSGQCQLNSGPRFGPSRES